MCLYLLCSGNTAVQGSAMYGGQSALEVAFFWENLCVLAKKDKDKSKNSVESYGRENDGGNIKAEEKR